MSHHEDNITVARLAYYAYIRRDLAAIEGLLAADFRFTSPLHNRLNRNRDMSHCWPAGQDIEHFEFVHLLGAAD